MINPKIEVAPDEDEVQAQPNVRHVPRQEPPQRPQPPQRQDIADARAEQRQRHAHNQVPPREQAPVRNQQHNSHQRPEPPRMPPPPAQEDHVQRSGLIDRGTISSKYGLAFGLFGVVCELNSFYTTVVGVYALWSIMFNQTRWAYLFGFVIASSLFIGQIFNSDFYEVAIKEDDDGEEVEVLMELPNRKRNYFLWLSPDAGFTMLFWLPPFVRLFTYIFFQTKVDVRNIRVVAELLGQAWATSWPVFFVFFLLCLLPATLLASAWSVTSSYYPEKALLWPRFREQVKLRIAAQFAHLQGAVGM